MRRDRREIQRKKDEGDETAMNTNVNANANVNVNMNDMNIDRTWGQKCSYAQTSI
jgi:hypothetical protein